MSNNDSPTWKYVVISVQALFLFLFFSLLSTSSSLAEVPVEIIRICTKGYVPLPPSEASERGKTIFHEKNCLECHSLRNIGGSVGPMLDGIGAYRDRLHLTTRLSEKESDKLTYRKLVDEGEIDFEHLRVPREEAEYLAEFLLTFAEPAGGFVVTPHMMRKPIASRAGSKAPKSSTFVPMKESSASKEGKRLFYEKGCLACHSIGSYGGWLGPSLDGIGNYREKEFLNEIIHDARAYSLKNPSDTKQIPTPSKMPNFGLSPSETSAITEFLLTLPELKDSDITSKTGSGPNKKQESRYTKGKERGRLLFETQGCADCHRFREIGFEGKGSISLDGLSHRRSRDFAAKHLESPEEHVRKNTSAFGGDPSLMPDPDLSATDLNAILDYLYDLAN
jgi:cytochrome c2